MEMSDLWQWLLILKHSDPQPIGQGSSQAVLVRVMTPLP
jgi:hypothetical protein